MKKTTLSLLAAASMAAAGIAQADVIFYPDGTSVELGDNGADSILASGDMSGSLDTTVLGAGPAVTKSTTTVTTGPVLYEYVQPNINWDRSTVVSQMRSNPHLTHSRVMMDRSAAATFDTPTRAGEMSTMTGGAPNVVTSNERFVVGSYAIPYSSITAPYYVMSY